MKKIKHISLLLFLIMGVGCQNFLEVEDIGRTSIPLYFSDMDGVRAALPGAYSAVYEYYDLEFYLYPDATGDMVGLNATGQDAKMYLQHNFISTPEDEATAVGRIWTYAYEAMANVNNVLEYIPELKEEFPQHEQELETLKGEALFLRALIHFDLVRVYAQPYNFTADASHPGIPVLLETPGPNKYKARNTVQEAYEQISEDLLGAEQILPESPQKAPYRASKEAAQALLSRVYLNMEAWEEAAGYADQVIDGMSLSTGEDYLDMFRTLDAGEEAIFRLNGDQKNSTVSKFYNPESPVGYASQKLVDLFDNSEDLRLQLLEDSGRSSTLKFSQPSVDEGEKQVDLFVLRLSEMYLNRAEANLNLNNLGQAVNDIKVIQGRALQTAPEEVALPGEDKQTLTTILEEERAKELSFEGHRLFDLLRKNQPLVRHENTTATVQSISYPDYRFILPIPQTEVDANENMEQNAGYE